MFENTTQDEILPCAKSPRKEFYTDVLAGNDIYSQGGFDPKMFEIKNGAVKLILSEPSGKHQIIAFRGEGDLIGHDSAVADEYRHSATALTKTRLLLQRSADKASSEEFRLEQMRKLFEQEQSVAEHLMMMSNNMRSTQKVAAFLLQQSKEATTFSLKMTKCDVANYLGITSATVSRALTKLALRGLILKCNNGEITILNPVALQDHVDLER